MKKTILLTSLLLSTQAYAGLTACKDARISEKNVETRVVSNGSAAHLFESSLTIVDTSCNQKSKLVLKAKNGSNLDKANVKLMTISRNSDGSIKPGLVSSNNISQIDQSTIAIKNLQLTEDSTLFVEIEGSALPTMYFDVQGQEEITK